MSTRQILKADMRAAGGLSMLPVSVLYLPGAIRRVLLDTLAKMTRPGADLIDCP